MRSKFKWIFSLLLALSMQFAFAQEKTVTGVVTDATGPIPGANVIIKGTQRSTQTDFDGKYSIKAKLGETLVFSFLGLEDQSKVIGSSNIINVKFVQSALNLVEVVVEGYGKTSTKAKSIGATQTVSAKTIEGRPNVSVLQSLQGQLAGANIALSSGQPGTNKIDVIIRGAGSLNASTDPLYVIDGVPLTQAFFRNLNQNDIETISVLKDASATSVYGNRGSNGVIVITTKKGDFKSDLSVNYSSSYGVAEFRGDDYNLVNAKQHLKIQKEYGVGPGFTGSAPAVTVDPNNIDSYAIDTDWKKVFFRTGTTSSQDISFTVGGENSKNFTSLGYFQQDGIVPTTDFKRFTLRSNFSGKSSNDRLTYGLNITSAYSKRKQLEQETRAGINNNVLQNPLTGYLTSAAYFDPATYVSGQQLFNDFGSPSLDIVPFMLLDLYKGNNSPSYFDEFKTILSGNFGYKLSDNLTFRTTAGADYAEDKRTFAIGPEAYLSVVRAVGAGQAFNGIETQRTTREFTFNATNQLNYNKEFGKHTLDASVFTEYLKAHRRSFLYQQTGLNPLTWSPGAGTGYITYSLALPFTYAPVVGASRIDAGLFSYFGTLDYDYDSKYGFAASLRRDASYRFVDDNKWGTFWSVAGRWNISRENFMLNNNFFKELKLRASYGTTGNQNVVARGEDSDIATIFGAAQAVRDLNSTQSGYGNAASFGVSSFANKDLKWETTAQANIGLDFNIKGRLTGSFDLYRKLTTDLYTSIPVSASNGFNNISGNNGSLLNKGVELSLRYDVLKNTALKLSIYGNGAYNRNEIYDLGVLNDGTGKQRIGTDFANALGGPLNQYFLVPYVGVNPVNGNLLFLDINGVETESPVDADRRLTDKNYLPVYQGGFGFNASYEGFFLDAAFTYAADFFRFDIDYAGLMDIRNVDPFPVSADILNAWTPTNTNSNVPSWDATNIDSGDLSDRFLMDASYVRLRNLSLGYNVPAKFLNKTFMKSIRFRLQAENIVTLTKWKGFDPETFKASTTGYFPTPKLYTFGIDVNF
ncbi:SusC/RagA family TonB-linked outer membrane protein [Flavobacterium yafengii]|uniref:SusC/RagA family TonB-linked outer membrane protein n=1 Tax=Flavobacterium yafengii TaxID=3041253 RepID=UPI0024A9E9E2|nr:SusC/RagA family TonB-linked outer membrane protein [Flavobacterium yafengii]MDI6044915.1 SusC/RagA family TonB-linked outer membrane protein [Flavobacterium yafengii]